MKHRLLMEFAQRGVQSFLRLLFCLSWVIGWGVPARAQTVGPAQLGNREKAFIANGGGDFNVQGTTIGVAEEAYNEFFTGIENWGRYELVENPATADWVFEISLTENTRCSRFWEKNTTHEVLQGDDQVEVFMMAAKTLDVRKHFVEHVKPASIFSDPDKLFEQTVAALIDDVKSEAGEASGKTPIVKPEQATAPIPSGIGSAAKVFIKMSDEGDANANKYSGGGTQVYDQFAAAMTHWGRYEITPAAGEADLIFQISFSMRPPCNDLGDPQIRLVIRDARNNVPLWGLLEHVDAALLGSNEHKNFAQAIINLVTEVRAVSLSAPFPSNLSINPAPGTLVAVNLAKMTAISKAPAVPVTISVTENVVKSGAALKVHVALKNNSKQGLDFAYPAGDPLTCMVVVRDAKGNPVADTEEGLKLKNAHAAAQGEPVLNTLNPGETQSRDCPVSDLYNLTAPGKYSIQVQQFDGRAVASNVVTVTVPQ